MIVCPGCGVELPDEGIAFEPRRNASGECWRLYGELSAYTLTREKNFIHQYAVDAYGAQHAAATSTNIGVAFTLIGLCLAIERNFTGREVQFAHMQLAGSMRWPKLVPPEKRGAMTVADVVRVAPGDLRDEAILRWMRSVWDAWTSAHEWTRSALAGFRLRR